MSAYDDSFDGECVSRFGHAASGFVFSFFVSIVFGRDQLILLPKLPPIVILLLLAWLLLHPNQPVFLILPSCPLFLLLCTEHSLIGYGVG